MENKCSCSPCGSRDCSALWETSPDVDIKVRRPFPHRMHHENKTSLLTSAGIVTTVLFSIFCSLFSTALPAETLSPDIYFLKGDYQNALVGYQRLSFPSPTSALREGICSLRLKRYEEAKGLFISILDFQEKQSDQERQQEEELYQQASLYLAESYLGLKERKEAIATLKKIIEDYPHSPFLHIVYLHLAKIYYNVGNGEKAYFYYKQLRREFPLSGEAREAREKLKSFFGPFSVQVGAFSDLGRAKALQRTLLKKGYEAYVVKGIKEGDFLFKVQICNFKKEEEALEFGESLKKRQNLDYFVEGSGLNI